MRIACWIRKATDTHLEYVILIAFRLQRWLEEHVSVLRNTYFGVLFYWQKRLFSTCGVFALNLQDTLASTHIATYL